MIDDGLDNKEMGVLGSEDGRHASCRPLCFSRSWTWVMSIMTWLDSHAVFWSGSQFVLGQMIL